MTRYEAQVAATGWRAGGGREEAQPERTAERPPSAARYPPLIKPHRPPHTAHQFIEWGVTALGLSEAMMEDVFNYGDGDGNGWLTRSEFVRLFATKPDGVR